MVPNNTFDTADPSYITTASTVYDASYWIQESAEGFDSLSSIPDLGLQPFDRERLEGPESSRGYSTITPFDFILHFITASGLDYSFNFTTSSEYGADISLDVWASEQGSHTLKAVSYQEDPRTVNADTIEIPRMMEWITHPLFLKSKSIWEALLKLEWAGQDDITRRSRPALASDACLKFFTPPNLEKFLASYWRRWSFNCPIIHESSFERRSTRPELVMVMALIGASMSSRTQVIEEARTWLDVTGELIFSHPMLSRREDNVKASTQIYSEREKLEVLQSSLLISVLQHWEGGETSRKRVRNLQYTAVTSVGLPVKLRVSNANGPVVGSRLRIRPDTTYQRYRLCRRDHEVG